MLFSLPEHAVHLCSRVISYRMLMKLKVVAELSKVKVEVKEELISQVKLVKEEVDLKPVKQEFIVVSRSVKQEHLVENVVTRQQKAFSVKQEPEDSKPASSIPSQAIEVDRNAVKQEVLAAEWWGNRLGFVRGGQLGSQQPRAVSEGTTGHATSERNAFCEQDQENLYKLVQVGVSCN